MYQFKKKSNIDYSAPHNRQMYFRMRLLRFYKNIEFDDDIYNRTASMILNGTLPYRHVNQIEKLRMDYEKRKKEKYETTRKKGATFIGYKVREVINSFNKQVSQ